MKQFNNITIVIFIILSFLALFFPKIISAEEKRNIFGIHISEVTDTENAAKLVNSSGGDWGWVTIVIRDDDMNFDKWQKFMDDCREKHLIPIVRIATHLDGYNWTKPTLNDAEKWSEFLNNLNWPVSTRYVTLFNEPNHAKEWGGEINPREYSRILSDFIEKLKVKSAKFQILNAGLDLAAPNSNTTMEAFKFIQEMNEEVPGIFEKLDGWSSHSYPNHGFKGKPWEYKKTSIRGYVFELDFLKSIGVQKQLPVFITETGWPKSEPYYVEKKVGKKKKQVLVTGPYYNKDVVSQYIETSFKDYWLKDSRIMAVTPFILNYPDNLFYQFSWMTKDGIPYEQYKKVQEIAKEKWRPFQETKAEIENIILPPFMPAEVEYNGVIKLKNTGQSIWGEYGNTVFQSKNNENFYVSDLILKENQIVKPGERAEFEFILRSGSQSGEFKIEWENLPVYNIKVFPASILTKTQYSFWEKIVLKINLLFGRK